MYRSLLVTCVLVAQLGMCQEALSNVLYKDVDVDAGPVRGFTAADGNYLAYLGIPYAAAPVGNRRFKSPLPPPPWDKLFVANRTVVCPQRGTGDENCLIVNVFTPTRLFDGPLPVLVYIHGGSFLTGSGQTKGFEPLIKQNVIVVTLNYRLGVLGFLCLGTKDAPGNAGLKDQIEALKWVQRNIGKFGGDPNRVTIYGMSAGGTSVEMLILSRMAQGLFHRAIIESGTASAVWSLDAKPIETANTFVSSSNFANETHNWYQLINFYQNEPAKELSERNYEYYQNLTDGTFGFVPCLENKLFGVHPFQWCTPQNIIKQELYNKVPLMFIFASLEGLFLRSSDYYELNYKDRMNARFEDFMPADLTFDTEEISMAVTENVKQFYFGNKTIDETTLQGYFNFFGDHLVLQGLLNSAVEHAKKEDVVYLMEFAYKGALGSYEEFFKDVNCAGHGDAIKYTILDRGTSNFKYLGEDDKLVVKRMTKIVANFMKYGNPSPDRSELIPMLWPAVQNNSVVYLRMDKNLQVLEEPHWERKLFWDKLYEKHKKPITPVDPSCLW